MNKGGNVKIAVLTLVALLYLETTRVNASAGITLQAYDATFFATTNGPFADQTGWLNDGDLVMMGRFTISDLTMSNMVVNGAISQPSFELLLSSFVPLNVDPVFRIGIDGAPPGDANSGAMSRTYFGNNSDFASLPIYVMAFNTGGSSNLATAVGVFKSQAGETYPADMDTGINTVDLTQFVPIIGTNITGISGSWNKFNSDGNWGNQNDPISAMRLDPIVIPEPSSLMLAGMGLLGTWLFRRRRH